MSAKTDTEWLLERGRVFFTFLEAAGIARPSCAFAIDVYDDEIRRYLRAGREVLGDSPLVTRPFATAEEESAAMDAATAAFKREFMASRLTQGAPIDNAAFAENAKQTP